MRVEAIIDNYEQIVLSLDPDPLVNDGDVRYEVFAEKNLGKFEHYQFKGSGFVLWMFQYKRENDGRIRIIGRGRNGLNLAFMMRGNLPYKIIGLLKGVTQEDHFNMMYLSSIDVEYSLKGGEEYAVLGIEYDLWWLDQRGALPDPLAFIVEQARSEIPARLCDANQAMTADIKRKVKSLSESLINRSITLSLELYSEIVSLTFKASKQAALSLNSSFALVRKVHDMIIDRVEEKLTAELIALEFSVDAKRLRNQFRKCFNMTVADFITQTKMRRAEELLKENSLGIKQIAFKVGYSSLQSFSDAYQAFSGIRPRQARQKMILCT